MRKALLSVLIVGIIAGITCGVFRVKPRYEATTKFALAFGDRPVKIDSVPDGVVHDISDNCSEMIMMRISGWKSWEMCGRVLDAYLLKNRLRAYGQHPVDEQSIVMDLAQAKFERVGYSFVIRLSVRSSDAGRAKDLADGYVEAIRQRVEDEQKRRVEDMVRDTHALVEQTRGEIAELTQIKSRSAKTHIDNLQANRETLMEHIQNLTVRICDQEGKAAALTTEADLEKLIAKRTAARKELALVDRSIEKAEADVKRIDAEIKIALDKLADLSGKECELRRREVSSCEHIVPGPTTTVSEIGLWERVFNK